MKLLSKQMLWREWLAGFGIFFLAGLSAFGQERYSFNRKVVNWGLKAGFNANAMMHLQVLQGEEELADVSFRNKSGTDITGFFRINLEQFFVQPELEWTRLNNDISFSLLSEEDSQQLVELSFKSQSIHVNGLIGYNIIKTGPFAFNVMVGSSLRYRFSDRYSILRPESKHHDPNPVYKPYGLLGFSMNISNVHFDIRYAISLLTANTNFDNLSDKPDWLGGISIYKRENILSFSCGVMF